LKLRVIDGKEAELIYYERPDQGGPKQSQYYIYRTQDWEGLKSLMAAGLGVRGVVRKCRWLYLHGQTRIHLDEVEGLGHFLELEYVLRPSQPLAEGEEIVRQIAAQLEVGEAEYLSGAYVDLLPNPLPG
jgi:predicted adenylyl cyclase CyaB